MNENNNSTQSPTTQNFPEKYKEWINTHHSHLEMSPPTRKNKPLSISIQDAYIPIEANNPFHNQLLEKLRKMKATNVQDPELIKMIKSGKLPEPPIQDAAILMGRKNKMLLHGNPGSGKTTLIKHLAVTIADGTSHEPLNGYLPVMIFLKDLWEIFYNNQNLGKTIELEDLLPQYLEKINCPLTWETIATYLGNQKALFLIDGLDEIPGDLRDHLVEIIARFSDKYKENRFLITGRPYSLDGKAIECFSSDLHYLEPLNPQMKTDFINKWFQAIGEDAGVFTEALQKQEPDPQLQETPLFLTGLCILHSQGKPIPTSRTEFYNAFMNLIEETEDTSGASMEFLTGLAFHAHYKNRRTISQTDALDILKKNLSKSGNDTNDDFESLLDGIINGCNVIHRLSSREIEFVHLTFQEFLAARYIAKTGEDYSRLRTFDWWGETILFLQGILADSADEGEEEIKKVVESILKVETPDIPKRNHLALLGARIFCDYLPAIVKDNTVENQLKETTRKRLYDVIDSRPGIEARIQAGIMVGLLGDTRIGRDKMVTIPAGEFIRGSEDGDDTKPVKHIYLDQYMIGKYQVTNHELREFVEDGGYQNKELWTPEGWEWKESQNITAPMVWNVPKWSGDNIPAGGVGFHEVTAYVRWLSKITGDEYRIPTEAQWEKAARGPDSTVYPYGNEFNKFFGITGEFGPDRTVPVGIFPENKSFYGCYDMSGNSWEWCSDWYDKDYYANCPLKNPENTTPAADKTFRSGGWMNPPVSTTAFLRNHNHQGFRHPGVGFRVVKMV